YDAALTDIFLGYGGGRGFESHPAHYYISGERIEGRGWGCLKSATTSMSTSDPSLKSLLANNPKNSIRSGLSF
ncbi:MAG: hypothetical protein QXO22_08735, partial [Thermosphaera sp.]